MANVLKIKLNEAEDRIINGENPQDVFDIVAEEFSAHDSDGRYARARIAHKIRFTPSLETRNNLRIHRICLIIFLFISAIAVFLNKQSRFEVFSFFSFNSVPSFFFFVLNNIYVWIYLFCSFAMFRWRLDIVWAIIFFTAIDFLRVFLLFPEHLHIEPFFAALRLSVVFISLILSLFIIIKSQNRYSIDKKSHSILFKKSKNTLLDE